MRPLVFTQVSIIDATGAPLQAGMTIVIRDGRIVSVGKIGRVRIPRGAQIVVAQGKFLVPGLWDMHAHLGTDDFDKQGHLALFHGKWGYGHQNHGRRSDVSRMAR